jgi:hypothetical protein
MSLVVMLAAFAPPEQVPMPLEPTQQQSIPKSWVPEKAPSKAPPTTLDVTPKSPSTYSHGTNLVCRSSGGPSGAARQFVEAYQGAATAFRNNQFSEAIRLAEVAAAFANDAWQWAAIEQMRVGAFDKLGNDAELIASLEALLATRDCLSSPQTANYRALLKEARRRLGTPR